MMDEGYRRALYEAEEAFVEWCADLIREHPGESEQLLANYQFLKRGLKFLCSAQRISLDKLRWYAENALPLMNLVGDWNEAIAAIERAFENPFWEGAWVEGRNWLAWFYELQSRFEEAGRAAQQGLAVAGDLEDQEAGFEALMRLAKLQRTQGRYREALKLYAEAGRKEAAINRPALRAYLLNSTGLTHWHLGELEAALACLEQAESHAQDAGDQRRLAQILNNRGLVLSTLGSLEEAEGRLKAGLELAERIGDQREIGVLCGNLGEAFLHLGRLEEALWFEQKAERIATELGGPYRIAKAKIRLSGIWRQKGGKEDLLKARELAREATVIGLSKEELHHFEILGKSYEAVVESALGDGMRACELSEQALARMTQTPYFDGSQAEIFFHHFLVMQQWDPESGKAALRRAYWALKDEAGRIGSSSLREQFYERIPFHQRILQAAESAGVAPLASQSTSSDRAIAKRLSSSRSLDLSLDQISDLRQPSFDRDAY